MEVCDLKKWIKTLVKEEIDRLLEMKIYHSFSQANGFDLNKIDFERGIFGLGPEHYEWIDQRYPEGHEYRNRFLPNEFGDKVVEIEVADNAKVYTTEHQLDVLEDFFKNDPRKAKIIQAFEKGEFGWERKDWHDLDKMIGKLLRKKGYQLIHYTADEMYGDTWTIIDKTIIKKIRFEND